MRNSFTMTRAATGAARQGRRRRVKLDMGLIMIVGVLSLWGFIILYPFYNAVLVSLVSEFHYIQNPLMLIPPEINFNAYRIVLSNEQIISGYLITIYAVVTGTTFNMILTVGMAYALTKRFPGRGIVLTMVIVIMFFDGGLIPTYLLIRNLGLIDNLLVYIFPTGFSPFYMFIVRAYFQSLPNSLEESAKIDGANELVILARIILPMSLPVLATVTLFYAVQHWNQYFAGLIYIRDISKRPLQLVLRTIIIGIEQVMDPNMPAELRENIFGEGVKMAAVVVTMAPVMFLYPFMQRYFMKGITIGAIKG